MENKRLLKNDSPHLDYELQQLKSLVSSLRTTLFAKVAALESNLTTTNAALSSANSKQAMMATELTNAKNALASANTQLRNMDSVLTSANSKVAMNTRDIAGLKSKGKSMFCCTSPDKKFDARAGIWLSQYHRPHA